MSEGAGDPADADHSAARAAQGAIATGPRGPTAAGSRGARAVPGGMAALVRMLLRDVRGGIIGWSIGLGAMTLLMVASFPSIEGQEELDDFYADFQDSIGTLFGDCVTITEFACYMDTQIVSFLPVLIGIFAVVHASRLLAGEEERGRLDLLLSTPVSRGRLVGAHLVTMAVAQTAVGVAVGVALALGAVLVGEAQHVSATLLVGLNAVPAALVVALVTYLASALWHTRRAPAMVGTVFLVGSYFLGGLVPLVRGLEPLRWGSITYLYQQSQPMRGGLDPVYYAVSFGAVAVLAALAWARFVRKDLTG